MWQMLDVKDISNLESYPSVYPLNIRKGNWENIYVVLQTSMILCTLY